MLAKLFPIKANKELYFLIKKYFSALSVDSSESVLGAVFFLDISNKKMYNINRVGENVTSIEEYDVASINATSDWDFNGWIKLW